MPEQHEAISSAKTERWKPAALNTASAASLPTEHTTTISWQCQQVKVLSHRLTATVINPWPCLWLTSTSWTSNHAAMTPQQAHTQWRTSLATVNTSHLQVPNKAVQNSIAEQYRWASASMVQLMTTESGYATALNTSCTLKQVAQAAAHTRQANLPALSTPTNAG